MHLSKCSRCGEHGLFSKLSKGGGGGKCISSTDNLNWVVGPAEKKYGVVGPAWYKNEVLGPKVKYKNEVLGPKVKSQI